MQIPFFDKLKSLCEAALNVVALPQSLKLDESQPAHPWLFEDDRHVRTLTEAPAMAGSANQLTEGGIHRLDLLEQQIREMADNLRTLQKVAGQARYAALQLQDDRAFERELFDTELGQPAFVGGDDIFEQARQNVHAVLLADPKTEDVLFDRIPVEDTPEDRRTLRSIMSSVTNGSNTLLSHVTGSLH